MRTTVMLLLLRPGPGSYRNQSAPRSNPLQATKLRVECRSTSVDALRLQCVGTPGGAHGED